MNAGPRWKAKFSSACGQIAYIRDGGECQYCKFVKLMSYVQASETDHVFGRSRADSLYLDHWILRLTLCIKCHHEKHHGKDGWWDQEKENIALLMANKEAVKPWRFATGTSKIQETIFARYGILNSEEEYIGLNQIGYRAWLHLEREVPPGLWPATSHEIFDRLTAKFVFPELNLGQK